MEVMLQLGLDLAVEETCDARIPSRCSCAASIGPRPRGRGNAASPGPSSAVPAGFNWASTSRSRKPSGMTPSSTPAARLQLGLDLAVEETCARCERFGTPLTSFNWASTSRSRKRYRLAFFQRRFTELQLGLDLAVEETCSTCA